MASDFGDDDDDERVKFTPEEEHELAELQSARTQLAEQVLRYLASRLGCEWPLSGHRRAELEEEFEDMTEAWDEANANGRTKNRPSSQLERLLHEHHELGRKMLNILDRAAARQRK